ncbi:MAG: serpin family protein [Bacteroidales bacterium]
MAFIRNLMFWMATAIVASFTPAGCDRFGQNDGNEEFTPIVLTKSQQAVAAKGDAFALDFVNAAVKSFPETNLFLSPMSLSMLTSMLANGAEGQTYKEIVKAIGMDGFTIDQVNDCYTTLVAALLKADKSVSLSLANSIWAAQGMDVRQAFKKQMISVYKADVDEVDFGAPSTLKTLNDWCSQKTSGLIPKMFDELDPQIRMILINALYFKGTWTVQFPKEQTAKAQFTTIAGASVLEDFMHASSETYTGYRDADVTVAHLPYGNGAFEMEVIMPSGKDFYGFLSGLTLEKLARWDADNTGGQKIDLLFPKFKAEFDTEKQLVPIMQRLGMQRAFNSDAEFGKISSESLYVSDMRQKTFVSVDEAGTEAAAVTVAEMRKNGLSDAVLMHFDHPFLYLIREKSTGVILFAGLKVK